MCFSCFPLGHNAHVSFLSVIFCYLLSFSFSPYTIHQMSVYLFCPPVCESGWRPGAGEPCDQTGHPQRPAVLHREEGTRPEPDLCLHPLSLLLALRHLFYYLSSFLLSHTGTQKLKSQITHTCPWRACGFKVQDCLFVTPKPIKKEPV